MRGTDLYNLFNDLVIITVLNQLDGYWQNIFQNGARWQSSKSIKKWGGSQLNANTQAQADALTTALSDIRSDFRLETEDILCARGI